MRYLRVLLLFACCLSLFPLSARAQGENQIQTNSEPAQLKVRGYGFFGNRELKAMLTVLYAGEKAPETFEANHVEDAALVLFSRLERDGYLKPTITARGEFRDGSTGEFVWTTPLGEPLPRPFEAKKVTFEIEPGVLFYFEEIQFSGLDNVMELRNAAHFFIETDALLRTRKNRRYSPEKLQNGLRNLEEALQRLGYESPGVIATNLVVQTNTGAVTVDIFVYTGPKSIVQTIEKVVVSSDTNQPPNVQIIQTNVIYSRMWEQDYVQAIRREQYRGGHADVRVEFTQISRELHAGTNWLDIRIRIFPGPEIHVADVKFEGMEATKESVMRRRVNVAAGDLLDPIQVERGRYRLARLGVFDSVELRYHDVDQDSREVIYTVDEGRRLNFSLLAGYGSYERLRGGFELEQFNIWGRAHSSRLKAVQSFKSSSAEYTYTMPELLGEDFDVFLNASGLRREEIAFTREEFGGGAGVSRHFREISTDLGARYSYQVLTATREDVPPEFGLRDANVASFIFDLRHDQRDNPLTPRAGYKVFSSLEVASEALLGDVDFQRMETSVSLHFELRRLQWIHFGLSHGFITTASGAERDLPINKRFFPGGDNSIRGFQYGEAAPRDASGGLVGAESYTLANVEFEQGITPKWSFVIFMDALAQATRIEDWPSDDELFAAGVGIRWKSIIGPVRLEYGHNLNPRDQDPAGTLHLSVGFPF